MTEKSDPKGMKSILVGTKNVISQLFFFWVFFLILAIKKTLDMKELGLILLDIDTASRNDNILEKKWIQEKKQAKEEGR